MKLVLRGLLLTTLFFTYLLLPSVGNALENIRLEEDEMLPRSEQSKAHHERIKKVLSSEDFARKKTVKRWRYKYADDDGDIYSESKIEAAKAMEGRGDGFITGLASVLEVILWGLFAFVILFVAIKYRHQVREFISGLGQEESEHELPTTMFGMDVQKTSMPKDIVQVAKQHWRAGEHRQGIALLLRGSLISLLHEHGCRFFDSDTESECCERIEEQAASNISQYMRGLVGVWQQVAYAHRVPSDTEFDALCSEWKKVF